MFTPRKLAAALAVAAALAFTIAAYAAAEEILEYYPNPAMPGARVTLQFTGSSMTVRCPVTMSGSLTSSQIVIATGGTIARVSRTEIGRCEGGSTMTTLALPWTVTYRGVEGTPPERVTRLKLQINEFSVNFATFGTGSSCLYGGNLEWIVPDRGSDPYTSEEFSVAGTLSRRSGREPCPTSVSVRTADGLWSALWEFFFGERLPMRSSPAYIPRSRAQGDQSIVITALEQVNVTAAALERGTRGWGLTLPPPTMCIRGYLIGEACTIQVDGTNATGTDHVFFRNETGAALAKVGLIN